MGDLILTLDLLCDLGDYLTSLGASRISSKRCPTLQRLEMMRIEVRTSKQLSGT